MATARIDPIQGLRGIAALLVVVDHSIATLVDKAGYPADAEPVAFLMGVLGVKIFFLISGFIMVVSTRTEFGLPGAPHRFMWRRLVRIVPLYWLATLIVVAGLAVKGHPAHLHQVLLSLLFVPYLNDLGQLQPVYGLGWTLNYEMFFYLLFATGLLLSMQRGLSLVIAALLAIVGSGQYLGVSAADGPASAVFAFWSDPIVLYFAGGMIIGVARGHLQRHNRMLPIGAPIAVGCCAALVSVFAARAWAAHAAGAPEPSQLIYSLPAMLLCGLAADMRNRTWLDARIRSLGDSSYSIYLTHSFLVGPCGRLWGRLPVALVATPFVIAMLIGASILGLFVYRTTEKPLLKAILAATARAPKPAQARL